MTQRSERNIFLHAFTLPELLVYMIIAGIVFLSVMEGFSLFNRYARTKQGEIISSGRFYDGYHRLANIINAADSVYTDGSGKINIYHRGFLKGSLAVSDSMLIFKNNDLRDTLLSRVAAFRLSGRSENESGINTVIVSVVYKDNPALHLSFRVVPSIESCAEQVLSRKEKEYEYE